MHEYMILSCLQVCVSGVRHASIGYVWDEKAKTLENLSHADLEERKKLINYQGQNSEEGP